MKRWISLLLALLILTGCGQRTIAPAVEAKGGESVPAATAEPSAAPTSAPETPAPTERPRPMLPTFAPKGTEEAYFAEELLSRDGEPLASEIRSLISQTDLSKGEFMARFTELIRHADDLKDSLLRLSTAGRTLTEDRKEKTVDALTELMSDQMLADLENAYKNCPGIGDEIPVRSFVSALSALTETVQRMENREVPFFSLSSTAPREYKEVLGRYMEEPVTPKDLFETMEGLLQTEAYALGGALTADPEAARKKERITFGSYDRDMAFLMDLTEALCPLPDGEDLPVPPERASAEEMELPELAFWQYPGMAFLRAYAAHSDQEQRERWANASDGYLAGLAIHNAYAVVTYLDEFGLDYVQYRWYEDMLYVTMTGMSALLIHYYGYTEKDLADYLSGWGAKEFASILYDSAMSDPFESLVASYGYFQYLDILQAAMDAGCGSMDQFLRDYMAAGPAPFEALKEYMVASYKNQG